MSIESKWKNSNAYNNTDEDGLKSLADGNTIIKNFCPLDTKIPLKAGPLFHSDPYCIDILNGFKGGDAPDRFCTAKLV